MQDFVVIVRELGFPIACSLALGYAMTRVGLMLIHEHLEVIRGIRTDMRSMEKSLQTLSESVERLARRMNQYESEA